MVYVNEHGELWDELSLIHGIECFYFKDVTILIFSCCDGLPF